MRELPIVKIGQNSYYVDERLNQLRNVQNPHDYEDITDDFMLAIFRFINDKQ